MNGCLTVVSNYLDQINAFHAVVLPGVTVAANENESQDSIDMAFNWGRMEMIIVGAPEIVLMSDADCFSHFDNI